MCSRPSRTSFSTSHEMGAIRLYQGHCVRVEWQSAQARATSAVTSCGACEPSNNAGWIAAAPRSGSGCTNAEAAATANRNPAPAAKTPLTEIVCCLTPDQTFRHTALFRTPDLTKANGTRPRRRTRGFPLPHPSQVNPGNVSHVPAGLLLQGHFQVSAGLLRIPARLRVQPQI
jgi:hypothetical protein